MTANKTTTEPTAEAREAYEVQPNHSVRTGRRSHVAGETVELTAADGERLARQGRVKRVDNVGRQGAIKNAAQRDLDKAKAKAAGLVAGTVAELSEAIAKMDAAQLDALETEEKAGKDRQGVADAIAARRAELNPAE